MSNEFIDDGFLKFPRPGYNMPEQTWHFNRFQSQQGKIEAISILTQKVAVGLNKPKPEAMSLILSAMPDNPEAASSQESRDAMAQLAEWVTELGEIANNIQLSKNTQERDIATMMFVSRLPIAWVLENRETLEAKYCVDLPVDKADLDQSDKDYKDAVDYSRLSKLKRAKWLDSKDAWKVMRAVTGMLPGSIIAEISDYAINEFRDGKQPEVAPPETAEERLGKPEPELPMPDEPSSD